MKTQQEFEEIAHSGGKVTFRFRTSETGRRSYQISWSNSRPVPASLTAVYALPPGIVVGNCRMGGIGDPWSKPPVPGCFPVLIASDSEGKFGHNCPRCGNYWRSGPWASVCPYCALVDESFQFLSQAQQRYVEHYIHTLMHSMETVEDGDVTIDMDAVAEATGSDSEKPAFYVSEERQQNRFTCRACGEFNDILGNFGYCSRCGTRNDIVMFEEQTIPRIRERVNSGGVPSDAVTDAVSAFDSFVGQYARQLADLVPMTANRKNRLQKKRFHNLEDVAKEFREWFDIDILSGTKGKDRDLLRRMFFRRHVYEHNGGEVDQRYLDESGDTSVRLKQHIRETQQDVNEFLGSLVKIARNLHVGFHNIIEPIAEPIESFEKEKIRRANHDRKSWS